MAARIHSFVALLALLVGWAQPARADDPVAHVVLFTASWCTHCAEVEEEVLPSLRQRFGIQLELHERDIDDPGVYATLTTMEDTRGVPPEHRGVPVMILGDRVFTGKTAIATELPLAIARALAEGGALLPEDLSGQPAPPPPPPNERSAGPPIHVLFFLQTGCVECGRARRDLEYVRARNPRVRIDERNVYDDAPLASWLASRAGRELITPAVFVGDRALLGPSEVNARAIEALIEEHEVDGARPVTEGYEEARGTSQLIERFRSFGPLAVVVAGLVDGINPCAFATLIFFISYLTVSGRRGRQVLAAGASFTMGVFLAYLGVGLGLYRLLDLFGDAFSWAGRVLMLLTALGCIVLAYFSFLDFLSARRGDLSSMKLTLPNALKERIRKTVRRGKNARAYVLAAFVTGVIVSFLELACTGQVYLPTIIFVTSVPELRATAVAYLVLYNVLFILPLVVVFVLVYLGTTSEQLTRWLRHRAMSVKLALAAFFAVLGAWLLVAAVG